MIEVKRTEYGSIHGWLRNGHLDRLILWIPNNNLQCVFGSDFVGDGTFSVQYKSEEELVVDVGGLLKLYFHEETQTWLL